MKKSDRQTDGSGCNMTDTYKLFTDVWMGWRDRQTTKNWVLVNCKTFSIRCIHSHNMLLCCRDQFSDGSRISQTWDRQLQDWVANLLFGQMFSKKMHENERNWTQGRTPALDLPLAITWTVTRTSSCLSEASIQEGSSVPFLLLSSRVRSFIKFNFSVSLNFSNDETKLVKSTLFFLHLLSVIVLERDQLQTSENEWNCGHVYTMLLGLNMNMSLSRCFSSHVATMFPCLPQKKTWWKLAIRLMKTRGSRFSYSCRLFLILQQKPNPTRNCSYFAGP